MYFPEKNCLLLHPGKTAGTSIERALSPERMDAYTPHYQKLYGFDPDLGIFLQHADALTARNLLGEDRFDSAFRFACVRNPYTRLLSVYYYLLPRNRKLFGSFKQFVLSLPGLVTGPSALSGNHITPQFNYVFIGDSSVCHRLIRFESIDSDYAKLAEDIGVSAVLKAINTRRNPDFPRQQTHQIYDLEMRTILCEVYRKDFEYLNYSFEP